MLLQRNTFKSSKTFFGGRQLFADSNFSCSMGNFTLAEKGEGMTIFQVIHNEIM